MEQTLSNEVKAKLTEALSQYGTVKVLKAGVVLTLLMTGKKLSNWNTVNAIQSNLMNACTDYPLIEVYVNSNSYLLLVLKPTL